MHVAFCRVAVVMCLAPIAVPAASQGARYWPRADRCMSEPTQGPPYSAEFILTSVQLLPSGELFKHVSTELQARDSAGRFYHATGFPPTVPSRKNLPVLDGALVCDPAHNTQTMWESHERRTIALQLPPRNERHGCWKSDDGLFTLDFEAAHRGQPASHAISPGRSADSAVPVAENHPGPAVESLGSESFQGVDAEGYRSSWPPTEPGQNDPPYLTEEHWVARSLDLWVSQEVTYPRKPNQTIKWSRELANLKDSEPDPALYRAPLEYPVTSEGMHAVSCVEIAPARPADFRHLH